MSLPIPHKPRTEIVIIHDEEACAKATPQQIERDMCAIFTGLTDAIRKHGCTVDLSDPKAIRVTK